MNFKWDFPDTTAPVSQEVLEAVGGRALIGRILQQRNMTEKNDIARFLYSEQYVASPPEDLPGMEAGVMRIEKAIREDERILVWGDFDVDGQTSTSLLYGAFKALGARVDYHIPVRAVESHGIRPAFLKPYLEEGIEVLVSCDTGIAAYDAVEMANEAGVDVVITDHHDPPEVLPRAIALINPKLFDQEHPLSNLPGVGVAYKLIEALYRRADRTAELTEFLDLVALGIVADLAILTEDTRYLLQLGMEQLRATRRPGLLQLMKRARVEQSYLIDEHIGFQLGPRLNAVGRLADANVSVPLLTTENDELASQVADDLERFNEERRFQTELVFASAMGQISEEPSLLQYAALVLAHETWHPGVIGIVASRLVEEYGKPTIMLATPEGEHARGSARSIEGYHITEAIATQAPLLLGYGGHPMAAGLSIDPAHIDAFRRGVSRAIVEQRTGEMPEPSLTIDVEVGLDALTHETVEELEMMAPFGPGNPPINLLLREVHIVGQVLIGKDKSHRRLVVEDKAGVRKEILWWKSAEEVLPDAAVDIVVRARPGFFRGEKQISITLQDMRLSGVRLASVRKKNRLEIADYRMVEDPGEVLDGLVDRMPDLQIWGEGVRGPYNLRARNALTPARALVIWTIPPDQEVLSEALRIVQPEEVYVFAVNPGLDQLQDFVPRFLGLINFARQKYQGITALTTLAGAMAHPESTIRCALPLLQELQHEVILNGDQLHITELKTFHAVDSKKIKEDLARVLGEVKAFRTLYSNAFDLSNYIIPS